MKTITTSKTIAAAIVTGLMFSPAIAFAGNGDRDARGFGGTVSCGGQHFNRLGGTEAHRTNYIIRNYNEHADINLDRVRVFDANGNVLFDSDITGMPVFFNGVLSASDTSLNPHQTAQLRTNELLGSNFLGQLDRPIQVIFDWSAQKKVLTLEVGNVRTSRKRVQNPDGSWTTREERGRHIYECRQTFTANGKGQLKNDDD